MYNVSVPAAVSTVAGVAAAAAPQAAKVPLAVTGVAFGLYAAVALTLILCGFVLRFFSQSQAKRPA